MGQQALAVSLPKWEQFAIGSGLALTGLNSIALLNSLGNFKGSCNPSNLKVRQEWRTLSKAQRKNFIAAVKCVQQTPSLFPAGQVPGSFSLFDDFVYVHLNQTPFIHATATFLTWHRYYTHAYEKRLQVCGYNGNIPYWEWGYDVNSPRDSPVFDGSDTSLGSDGAYVQHEGLQLAQPGVDSVVSIAPGTGGGCVYAGPFANMTVHLGPVAMPLYGSTNSTGEANPVADNPRCLKRDLNADSARRWTTFRNTTDLILNNQNVEWFQAIMQGDPRYGLGSLGVPGGGHYIIGGDPGSDPFISPGDPVFYLHHAQIDRIYWIWQMLDFANRQNVFGTGTIMNTPPSNNVTVNEWIDITPLNSENKQIKDLMSTVGGSPFCYVYI
ncbi:tyrosinase-like protein [Diplogelasinospora grovesii]|uniref:Tyrosinase-like protein n=1 Tax=Diplogelasinospora grovesii TaxID=303347 RepID=A0AAN6N1G2_9PEZI|nr:tyrosinase-like protein [Diplogelasinospora grovesii]